jgi:hypothetical protein
MWLAKLLGDHNAQLVVHAPAAPHRLDMLQRKSIVLRLCADRVCGGRRACDTFLRALITPKSATKLHSIRN